MTTRQRTSIWSATALTFAAMLGACSSEDGPADTNNNTASDSGAGSGGAAGGGMDGASGGTSAGACLSAGDSAVLGTMDPEAEIPKCVKPLVTGGKLPSDPDFTSLVSACVAKSMGLSSGCADCYAGFATCSALQCLAQCIADPKATQCSDCRCGKSAAKDCISELVACSGVEDDTCG